MPASAFAQFAVDLPGGGDIEVTIHYEGIGDGNLVGFQSGLAAMTFDSSWMGIEEGPYEDPPSPVTVAMWWDGGSSAEVTFNKEVTTVTLSYASVPDVTIKAYDASNNLLDEATGLGNYSGSGRLDTWDVLTVTSFEPMAKLVVEGTSQQTYIDDFKVLYTTDADQVVATLANDDDPYDPGTIHPHDTEFSVVVYSTTNFDATTIDLESVRWGDVRCSETVAPYAAAVVDADEDGLDDLRMSWLISDVTATESLVSSTRQVYLTGNTLASGPPGLEIALANLREKRDELAEKHPDHEKPIQKLDEAIAEMLQKMDVGVIFHAVEDIIVDW